MSHHRSVHSHLINILGAIVALTLALAFLGHPAGAAAQGNGQPSKRDRELIAQARAEGKSEVPLIIAAVLGQNNTVISGIQALGGDVDISNATIGYVQATVPIDKAEAAFAIGGVKSMGLDEVLPLEDPRPQGIVDPTPQPPPDANTPRNNPYMPIGDTGAAQFTAVNPTWDGRGTTIAIVDSGVDLGHPALQTTTTGERKIIDWVTFTSPTAPNDNDATWLRMNNAVSGSTFTFQGVTYTAPANGSYRIARFNERDTRLGGEVGSDVNRDGNPAGSSGIFAVLWDKISNLVWVDANQNNSFADEQAMTDYKVRYDIGTFGTDNPATAVREAMPFVVEIRPSIDFVNIGIVSGAHGSHVAGITSANRMFGGAMSGAAPGAKLVSIRVCLFISGCTSSALINGMIYAVQVAKVDVINMSIGGLPALNAGENNGPANTRAILYNNLIDQGVQMFISAGNSGPGVNTIGDPAVAAKVMSVGSYITDATWRSNYGSNSAYVDNIHNYSSRGPREDGGFKPEIIAPGAAVSTVPTWQGPFQVPTGPAPGAYTLPPGYDMFNGTSMASPQAAGAAALLISAAKQTGVQHSPAQLRQAIRSTARYIDKDRFEAYDQGNGLFRVESAWNMLRKNLTPVDITSSVAVNTLLSGQLKTPGFGIGIYDREGVAPNTTLKRTFTFKRTSGGTGSISYNVKWTGDVSAYSSAAKITLPLNQDVTLDVTIKVGGPGTYSSILRLENNSTKGIDFQTMNTVIVADQFTAGNKYNVTKVGTVGRNQMLHFFYNIPAGTPAFKVDLTGTTGQVRFLRFDSFGLSAEPTGTNSLQCYSPPVPDNGCNGVTRTVTNPQAGVWEVTIDTRRTSDANVSNFTLTASILGASVSPNPDTIASATAGTPMARTYTLTNLFGAFTGRAVGGGALGSARRGPFSIAHLEQQQYPITVTPGSTSLRATIGGPSDPAADLDLFVFNCTTGTCVQAGQSADGDSEESVTINNPAAGLWVVLIDGFAVPAGTTSYNYVDVFVNPAFGSVGVTDANALRPAGASWIVSGIVTANAAPGAGRVLLGNVQVRTDADVLIGQGDVVVQSVTP
jgi:subtilisin family serine protease